MLWILLDCSRRSGSRHELTEGYSRDRAVLSPVQDGSQATFHQILPGHPAQVCWLGWPDDLLQTSFIGICWRQICQVDQPSLPVSYSHIPTTAPPTKAKEAHSLVSMHGPSAWFGHSDLTTNPPVCLRHSVIFFIVFLNGNLIWMMFLCVLFK